MNKVLKTLLTNFSYTLTSNLVTLIISVLMVLILPKLIGLNDYGYWQLYLFYISYLGFFNIGWVEGIYLRYGGAEFHQLNKSKFAGQFFFFTIYISIVAMLFLFSSYFFINDIDKEYILIMVSLSLLVTVPRGFLLYVLQTTNRIKEFSLITLLDRFLYLVIISTLLLIGVKNYELMIGADFAIKLITLIISLYLCREIVFLKTENINKVCKEVFINISVGIKLMFANIASMLIIGVVRFGIERSWDIATFGKVSLVLSISNLMMVFVNALGIVLFPILKRTETEKYSKIYINLRNFLIPTLLLSLVLYFPLKIILQMWLPLYLESLKFLSLMLPIIVFEGKMALLINTYLKTLREEYLMLKINIIAVICSIVVTYINTVILKNLEFTIFSIVVLLAIRSSLAEIILAKKLNVYILKDLILELAVVSGFILITWFSVNEISSFVKYFIVLTTYFFLKKDNLNNSIHILKKMLKT